MVANVSTPVVLTLNDFGAYSDIDGPPTLAAVQITALPSAGSLQHYDIGSGTWKPVLLNDPISAADIAAGRLQFVPDAGEFGMPYATFGFKVGDGQDFSTESYTLAVNVTFQLSSVDGSNGFQISGAPGSSYSVASVGDFNGDGFDDFVIGQPAVGASYVVLGGPHLAALDALDGSDGKISLALLNGTDGFKISGAAPNDQSGFSVAAAGDVNGDGLDDLIIGAPGPIFPQGTGHSYVVFGTASGSDIDLSDLNGTNGFKLTGVPFDLSGRAVASAGDINGDGFDDLIIAAPGRYTYGFSYSWGASYVVFGGPHLAALDALDGSNGDINLALLNGTDGFRINGEPVFGTNPATLPTKNFSVAPAGDVNGDGIDDLIIGQPGVGQSLGATYVVFGTTSGFSSLISLSGLNGSNGYKIAGASRDYSSRSVSAGDINGDGFDDLIIGAWNARSTDGSYTGASYVVFGGPHLAGLDALDGTQDGRINLALLDQADGFKIAGVAPGDQSGFAVASSAGDINGDGFDDLVIGARFADDNGSISGASYVVFGGPHLIALDALDGLDGRVDLALLDGSDGFPISGVAPYDQTGFSVAVAGDVNGDGFDDLIIGAPGGSGDVGQAASAGASFVLFGGPFGAGTTPIITSGTSGADILIGGLGNDTLIGNGGPDVIRSGAGDDLITVSDPSFARIDGGTGTDTLKIDGSGPLFSLDLTQIPPSVITDIEHIDLGNGNTLTLSQLDVFDLTSERTDGMAVISVEGTGGSVTFADSGWSKLDSVITEGSVTYDLYALGNAEVRVQQGLAVNFRLQHRSFKP